MCRIAMLPSEVIEQIAAGEVVERPASVVKELIENALDAGASQITVELTEGGRRRIRVVDDGGGMSSEEVELALRRHATSKLSSAEDLWSVRTMGFRGEGLASIAAVSRLTLDSRRVEDEAGWRVEVAGGTIADRRPLGRSVGTTVVVEDLFFNTPGRLKFLKTTASEAAHAADAVSRLACGFSAVGFSLVHNGREVLDLPRAESRIARARLVARRRGERLRAASLDEEGLSVEACLGPAEDSLSTTRQLVLLVNGRPVQDRGLVLAIVRGYGTLPAGRYPVGALFVDLDPRAVDVNVHPQKREVRFRDVERVLGAVERCVCRCVGVGAAPGASPARTYQLARRTERVLPAEQGQRAHAAAQRFWAAQLARGGRAGEALDLYSAAGEPAPPSPGDFGRLRILGQSVGGFVVCEDEAGIVLVDIGAARTRVALWRLREALAARGALPAQHLLVPPTFSPDDVEASLLEGEQELLQRLGLELERFGGASWVVRSIPEPLAGAEPVGLVRELLAALREGAGGAAPLDRALLRLARAAGVADETTRGVDLLRGELRAMDDAGLALERDALCVELSRAARRAEAGEQRAVALRIAHTSIRRRFEAGIEESEPATPMLPTEAARASVQRRAADGEAGTGSSREELPRGDRRREPGVSR